MRPIFLPDTAMGDDDVLVQEFYRYMYHCHEGGGIFGSILGTGMDADVYAALYYSGEIRNGGHQQFIANSDNSAEIAHAALSGLAAIGAQAQHAILADMRGWALENPQYVEMIFRNELPSLYRPGRPPALDSLDDRFFAEQDRHSVEARAARWIRAYPGLTVIAEAEFLILLQTGVPPAPALVSPPGGAKIGLWDRVLTTIFGR